jgi:putative ABC transport system permease protein
MHFFNMPLRNLSGRPMRSSLSALGVALAVASFITLLGLARGIEHAWITTLIERDTHVMVMRKGAVEILTASIDEQAAQELRQIAGVRDVAGEMIDLVALGPNQPVLVTGWAPDSFLWRTLRLSTGSLPGPNDPQGVVLGQALALTLQAQPGHTLTLLGQQFRVTGIARPAGSMNNNMVFLSLHTMQRLLNRPGRVTVFNLRLERSDHPESMQRILSRLRAAFPDLTFTETRLIADHNDLLRMGRAMAWGISTIALVMGMLGVLNTLLMSVTERMHEFGVLSAVGWRPARILAMIVMEGLAITMAGSAVGTLLGIYGLYCLARMPPLYGFLEPEVGLRLVVEVCAATVLLGVIGSLYPAWRGVRLNPIEALKYQ